MVAATLPATVIASMAGDAVALKLTPPPAFTVEFLIAALTVWGLSVEPMRLLAAEESRPLQRCRPNC